MDKNPLLLVALSAIAVSCSNAPVKTTAPPAPLSREQQREYARENARMAAYYAAHPVQFAPAPTVVYVPAPTPAPTPWSLAPAIQGYHTPVVVHQGSFYNSNGSWGTYETKDDGSSTIEGYGPNGGTTTIEPQD
jgi:hypothetical protein